MWDRALETVSGCNFKTVCVEPAQGLQMEMIY